MAPSKLSLILTALTLLRATPLAFSDPTTAASQSTATADPFRLTIADWLSPDHHGPDDDTGNIVVFRAYVPWTIVDIPQLSRLTIPVTTKSAGTANDDLVTETASGPTGLGDIEFYDVSELNTSCGQFQIGPVFAFPSGTRSGVGKGKWTAGPVLGFKTRIDEWTLGIFSQGFFSFAGSSDSQSVSRIKVQPIVEYSLPHGWDVGTSDMNFTYDWTRGQLTNIPVGFDVGKRFKIYSQDMRFSGQAEYNLSDKPGTAAWTFRFTLEYVLPQEM